MQLGASICTILQAERRTLGGIFWNLITGLELQGPYAGLENLETGKIKDVDNKLINLEKRKHDDRIIDLKILNISN